MSAMSDMLGDILKKAIPKEVMDMLTPENIQAFADKANATVQELRGTLTSIEESQSLILKRLERIENDGYNRSNGTIASANDSGDGKSNN